MREQNYPARGKMSEDGKYYTHTDGSVHSLGHARDCVYACKGCSLLEACGRSCNTKGLLCGQRGPFQKVEGAHVPTDEDREACYMARAMIRNCRHFRTLCAESGCLRCSDWSNKSCAGRKWLADHGDETAWEVNP